MHQQQPQLSVHLDCITVERRYECGKRCFTTQLNIFYFSILIMRILKKKKMLLLLCPSPVMDFLVDHGVLWAADLTQHLGFGKIQWNASQNQAL